MTLGQVERSWRLRRQRTIAAKRRRSMDNRISRTKYIQIVRVLERNLSEERRYRIATD